jgi:hypothetical protein
MLQNERLVMPVDEATTRDCDSTCYGIGAERVTGNGCPREVRIEHAIVNVRWGR